MHRVDISARLIDWPRNCPCCLRPADTKIDVSATRITGVKVIRELTKTESVPYCRKCLSHMNASARLVHFRWKVVHRPAVFALLAIVLVCTGVMLLSTMPALYAVVFGTIWAALFCLGVYVLFPWTIRSHRKALLNREQARMAIENAISENLCDGCVVEDVVAIEYAGWSGSVHTFYFSNPSYAHQFREANARKIVD